MSALAQMPFLPENPLDMPAALVELQKAASPLHKVRTPDGDEAWYVTGYELLKEVMADPRLGRTHPDPVNAARGSASVFLSPMPGYETEAEDHARSRELLTPHFAPKHLRSMSEMVDRLTTEAFDRMEAHGSPADMQAFVGEPVPILVICELLGVPPEDQAQFRSWVADVGSVSDHARSEAGLIELLNYGLALVANKRANPTDDVISRLATTEGVDDFEAATLSMQLLFAGHETTVVTIGLGSLQLLNNREEWDRLVANPDRLARGLEEVLRAGPPGGLALPRWAKEDIEIAGQEIKEGELVLLDLGSANHDASVFSDPFALHVDRKDAIHVTFGYGPRYCIGAALARMELKAVFGQMITRFPTMRLAVDAREVEVNVEAIATGVRSLPVEW